MQKAPPCSPGIPLSRGTTVDNLVCIPPHLSLCCSLKKMNHIMYINLQLCFFLQTNDISLYSIDLIIL